MQSGDSHVSGQALRGERKCGDMPAGAAGHQGLLDTQRFECWVGAATATPQVHAATGITAPGKRVVVGETLKLAFILLSLRLRLLGLKAKIAVLTLQHRNPLSQKAQMLTQHRRRCMLAEQRLKFVEQSFKHFVHLHLLAVDRSSGGAA